MAVRAAGTEEAAAASRWARSMVDLKSSIRTSITAPFFGYARTVPFTLEEVREAGYARRPSFLPES